MPFFPTTTSYAAKYWCCSQKNKKVLFLILWTFWHKTNISKPIQLRLNATGFDAINTENIDRAICYEYSEDLDYGYSTALNGVFVFH